MVAYFYHGETQRLFPRYEAVAPSGLPIIKVALPQKYSRRRLAGLVRRLYRKGLRRFLPGDPALTLFPLTPVDPLPLCRAKGAELVLALLAETPLRQRRAALRGETAGPEAWRLAETLCPQVGSLYLDFDRGEKALSHHLRERFGAAPLHLGQGPAPQAAVELDPRPFLLSQTLRLWGEPDLLGMALGLEQPPPPGLPPLPLLELLWETGRVELEEVRVGAGRNGLDRWMENTYNNRTA